MQKTFSILFFLSKFVVGDEDGGDGPAEAEYGRGHDDCHGGSGGGDDGAHGQGQYELGKEHHGGHDSDIGADTADLTHVHAAALLARLLLLGVLIQDSEFR